MSTHAGRKNILVTGGAGFVGSHLCEALVAEANVICVDNFSTSSVQNIEQLLQNPHFEFLNHDITQPLAFDQYPELRRFQIPYDGLQEIYHLACPISRKHFEELRVHTLLTNSLGTKNVLDVAVAYRSKLLVASSSVLYGPRRSNRASVSEEEPCTIDHLTPHGAYDEGKRFNEAIAYTYADVHRIDVKISRMFRTYGPRMKLFDGSLLPDLIHAALDGRDMEFPGTEETRVSLCYISDMVQGLMAHMASPVDIRVVNLGSDQEVTLPVLARFMLHLTGSHAAARFSHTPTGSFSTDPGPPHLARAREVLHWFPLVRLEDGLRAMIDDARSRRQQSAVFSV